ncbi:MAG: FIG00501971: hypothetical protein, partial [uncultured Gemmatimonadaceae bacterium]
DPRRLPAARRPHRPSRPTARAGARELGAGPDGRGRRGGRAREEAPLPRRSARPHRRREGARRHPVVRGRHGRRGRRLARRDRHHEHREAAPALSGGIRGGPEREPRGGRRL